eukprot:jgi/Mesvir1/596/Mv02037-RA.1
MIDGSGKFRDGEEGGTKSFSALHFLRLHLSGARTDDSLTTSRPTAEEMRSTVRTRREPVGQRWTGYALTSCLLFFALYGTLRMFSAHEQATASGFYATRPRVLRERQSLARNTDDALRLSQSRGPYRWERHVEATCRAWTLTDQQRKLVLVTGAAGFVGFHSAALLASRGDSVIGLDNYTPYYPAALKYARTTELSKSGIHVVDADLCNEDALTTLFRLCPFTHVLHLAAQAGVRYAVKNPMAYVSSNVQAFVTLLEVVKVQKPPPAVVYASSSSVYGLSRETPFSEDGRTDTPASLYAATKKADEALAHTYHHINGLSITGLRFFTVYGPWGRPDMAYFSFTRNIMAGETINVFRGPGGEELSRDFTYITDIVAGTLAALDTATPSAVPGAPSSSTSGSSHRGLIKNDNNTFSGGIMSPSDRRMAAGGKDGLGQVARDYKGGKAAGPPQYRIYNLGNTQPVSVTQLVSLLEKHLGRPALVNHIPLPPTGDVLHTHANITRAQRELGYHPTTNLDVGLRMFVEWYKETFANERSPLSQALASYRPL